MAKLNIINRITSDYDQGRMTDVMRDVQETVNKNIEGDKNQTFQVAPATTGTMAPPFQQVQDRLFLSVFDYFSTAQIADVKAQTTSVNVTTAIQTAIAAAQATKRKLFFPAGNYLITDSLSIAEGTQIEGETEYQYNGGFGVSPKATTITFRPTTQKSLFVADGSPPSGFRFHISVKNLYIVGNSVKGGATTSLYALDLNAVIYAHFENISIEDFNTPIKCTGTINNRFVNIFLKGTVSSLIYTGSNETTDVWDQCTFFGSPLGVSFLGSSVGVRFSKCLFEQIDTYAMDIAKECQVIMVDNCYAEDVPFNVGVNNCMFRVGYTGTTLAAVTSLQINGGFYNGRSAGVTGNFIDCDYVYGVQISGVYVHNYTNIIRTTANTSNWSVNCNGIQWLNCTTVYNDKSKISGQIDMLSVSTASGTTLISNVQYSNESYPIYEKLQTASATAAFYRMSTRTASVSTSAATTVISTINGGSGNVSYCYVYGHNNAGASFFDIILASNQAGTVTVLSSTTTLGAPAARTYSIVAGTYQIKLQMAATGYNVNVLSVDCGNPFTE